MENQNMTAGYQSVMKIAKERPDWLPIVEVCLEQAQQTQGGEFAGTWVLNRAKDKGMSWSTNLKPLASIGILKHVESSRGGHRAYYTMPDIDGVAQALKELKSK